MSQITCLRKSNFLLIAYKADCDFGFHYIREQTRNLNTFFLGMFCKKYIKFNLMLHKIMSITFLFYLYEYRQKYRAKIVEYRMGSMSSPKRHSCSSICAFFTTCFSIHAVTILYLAPNFLHNGCGTCLGLMYKEILQNKQTVFSLDGKNDEIRACFTVNCLLWETQMNILQKEFAQVPSITFCFE